MIKYKVEVLLSSYNGETFIKEQLASIASQSIKGVHLSIRDDGSTDDTLNLIRNFCAENPMSRYIEADNIGVVGSFLSLLQNAALDNDFVAFSDQDDVWHREKLEVAIKRLSEVRNGYPAMYCCRTRLVDQDLAFIGYGHGLPRPAVLKNALIQNVATGCTIVLNREAIDLLQRHFPDTDNVLMHDWWVYIVVSAFGEVCFDDNAYIDYRQHERNIVGVQNGLQFWLLRFSRILNRDKCQIVNQVKEFFDLYGTELPEKEKQLCLDFVNEGGSRYFFKRLLYAIKAPVYRQSVLDDILFRALVIGGVR
jgi:glycosyltransferase involved in cell wall biosynthesis